MKKLHLVLSSSLLFCALAVAAKAQSSSSQSSSYSQSVSNPMSKFARRSVNFDVFGNKGFLGGSFEYRFGNGIEGFGVRAGFGYLFAYSEISSFYAPYSTNNWAHAILFPIEANYLFFKSNHHLELGAGVVPCYFHVNADLHRSSFTIHERAFSHSGNLTLAYRYQRPQGGFNLRVGISPMFRLFSSHAYVSTPPLYPFLSVGYSF